MQFVKPIPFQEAIDKLGSKSLIGSKLSSSEWSDVPVALRERAFFSSQVESARFLQRARNGIADFLQSNRDGQSALKTGSRADFVKQLQDFLAGEGVLRTDGGLKDLAGERRLSLIFNTQTQQANDYAYRRQGLDPDVLDAFPAQRFIRVLDVKEPRLAHAQYEDQVYLKSDPIWTFINQDFGVPWGPWGWGCGHDVEDVDREEAESLGLIAPGETVQAPKEDFNAGLQASTAGLDPDLLAKLQDAFGDQLVIQDGAMQWRSDTAAVPPPAVESPKPKVQIPNPQPAPEPAPALAPAGKPVSQALVIRTRGTAAKAVRHGLESIDKVHDDGVLPSIPVGGRTAKHQLGVFASVRDRVTGQRTADSINVKPSGPWPALTSVHEVGHFLDLSAIGPAGEYATLAGHAPMVEVLNAAVETKSIQALRERSAKAATYGDKTEAEYFLKPQEIWARAYAQFIAERSGSPILKAELAKVLENDPQRQWTAEDFAPIARQIETLFRKLGWL